MNFESYPIIPVRSPVLVASGLYLSGEYLHSLVLLLYSTPLIFHPLLEELHQVVYRNCSHQNLSKVGYFVDPDFEIA